MAPEVQDLKKLPKIVNCAKTVKLKEEIVGVQVE
jgi:hypothetical protein